VKSGVRNDSGEKNRRGSIKEGRGKRMENECSIDDDLIFMADMTVD
jgi:hypothetical protein